MAEKNYRYQSNIFDVYTMEEMKETYCEVTDTDPLDSVSDEQLYDFFYHDFESSLDYLMYELSFIKGSFLVVADIGRWSGRFAGGKVYLDSDLSTVVKDIVKNEDDFELYYTGKSLHVDTHNHDASSYFDLYIITNKGCAWYQNNQDNYSDRDLHDHLRRTKGYIKNIPDWWNVKGGAV